MPEERTYRRLAAILAADVVGYSRLMEQDEAGTFAVLKERRKRILEPLVGEHRGRIIKVMGDGALVEFASAVNAAACAIELQQRMAAANASLADDRRVVLRIGINLGDVMVEGGDLYGDGVNIAARLEQLAEPGGIWLSDKVQREVRGTFANSLEDLGERKLKNIAQPIHVYRLQSQVPDAAVLTGAHDIAGIELTLPSKPSIVVLPFENLSAARDSEFLVDGMTQEIITGLSWLPDIFVIARQSSFAFKGQPLLVTELGRRLGVAYVLQGSLQRSGQRVRIGAQLVEAATGKLIWAERYDRTLKDVFAIQEDIMQRVAVALQMKIGHGEAWARYQRRFSDFHAWELYVHGLEEHLKLTRIANQRARELVVEALALEPEHPGLLFLSAIIDWTAARFGYVDKPAEAVERAEAIATQLLETEYADHAHAILGVVKMSRNRYEDAVHHGEQAVVLRPNDASNHGMYAMILNFAGKGEAAMRHIRTAIRLSPYCQLWCVAVL
jgi:adenylate cyclase